MRKNFVESLKCSFLSIAVWIDKKSLKFWQTCFLLFVKFSWSLNENKVWNLFKKHDNVWNLV